MSPLGIGTGMQLNSRVAFGIPPGPWDIEQEVARYLVELGPVGYLAVWGARLGLVVALLRASWRFRRAKMGGFAGLALAYALLTFQANMLIDHVWQALEFIGIGMMLRAAAAITDDPVADRKVVDRAERTLKARMKLRPRVSPQREPAP